MSEIPETGAEAARGTIFWSGSCRKARSPVACQVSDGLARNLGPFDERERGEALKMPGSNR